MSEQWDFYFARVNDKLASFFVDLGIRDSAPDASNPWLLWVRVYFNSPREDGLSSSEESDTLFQIEDSITEAVANATKGRPVGRITTDGQRAFYFYSPSFVGFEDAVARGLKAFPGYRWDSGSTHDPEWSQYLTGLYPSPRDWQRITNRRVIEQLMKGGDSLQKERPVFHWAYFRNEQDRGRFVAAVQDLGYTITNQAERDDHPYPFGAAFERLDRIDWDSINHATLELFELARSFAGKYDGWETSVEKDA